MFQYIMFPEIILTMLVIFLFVGRKRENESDSRSLRRWFFLIILYY